MTLQYFKPQDPYFVGDCMPFYHDRTFRLFYLLDENHHAARDGLGGHQWAQASSQDLVHWQHHPLAIPITEDREGSICTGSVFFQEGVYYGFYATRMRDYTQHLSLATSHDAIHFEKIAPNPFASPPAGYDPLHYRDPVVFQDADTGLFHMLVTANLVDWPIGERGGCLAHLISSDLAQWDVQAPFLIPGLQGTPECPDYFEWNGWYYLVFSSEGVAHYRMSRTPLGPWQRPVVDTLDGPAARVMKTAPFGADRRIGVAWLGTRRGDTDDGRLQFGGNALFRELVQHEDGTLGAKFPAEMALAGEPVSTFQAFPLDAATRVTGRSIHLAANGLAAAECAGIPRNARLKIRVHPQPNAAGFGLRFGSDQTFDSGYDLHCVPAARVVTLQQQWLLAVDGLDRPFTLEVVLLDDIIDVCIDDRRTLVDRCPERRGAKVVVYAEDSAVTFEMVEITALA